MVSKVGNRLTSICIHMIIVFLIGIHMIILAYNWEPVKLKLTYCSVLHVC